MSEKPTAGEKIAAALRKALDAGAIADAQAHLSFTFRPTGHRVSVSGDFVSIEIVRLLIEQGTSHDPR